MIDRNKIPASWEVVKLGKVCETTSGGTPSRKVTKYYGGKIPWVKSGELEHNIILDTEERITEEAIQNSSAKIFPKGTLLIALYGATVGKLAFLGIDAATNQAVCGIFKNEIINSKFLYQYLFFQRPNLIGQSFGGAQPNISQTILKELEIPLPPLSEQHRIISKIEELFSELDKGIESLKTAQRQLKVYRQAVLKWAFEGRLTEEWRKENAHLNTAYDYLRQVSEIRKKNFLEAKKNGIKRIEKNYDFEFRQSGEINTWANATLNKLIYIAGRIGWRGLTKDEYTTEGPLFLSVYSLNYGKYVEFKDAYHISEERYLESPEIMLKDKDILLCKDGAGIGKIGIINKLPSEATVNSSLLVIRGMEIFIPEFLYRLLSGPKLQSIVRKRITGSATPHLFQNDIRKFELLIPPPEEQVQIVSEIDTRLSVCDKLEETITTALQQSEALRQSILKKAFEGKLVEQNPKDESTAKLLERIKAEKAAEQRNVYRRNKPLTK
ncbi:MAG: Type I restriction-modification system, specificity subunit S [Candidatus Jettenia ecosi]|uniref:Type I restriction-modification system, specificity subunit S n=1 Tax=Candidatus Jettenia ecosi TaxID=2494326 RepID=A0A533QA12_9BACT|nr:MAG: Type I restriction-modification system, specificity subunit S [Candidatus Jettenia ecosi]